MPLLIWKSILIRKLVSNHIVLFFQDSSIRWIMLISREFCFHLSMSFNTKRGYGGDFTFCKVIFNDIQGQVWSAHLDHSSLFLPWRNRDLRVPEKQAFLSGGISNYAMNKCPFSLVSSPIAEAHTDCIWRGQGRARFPLKGISRCCECQK